ncbi:tetratricopeptide repeat protein [Paenibacillus glycanilyticus]|uniref:Tetratricopeptide repeat protein n=1 Tax=Paenibacillus glycanilyticus TaxID=126569 RepID=A0ABQ6GGJ1_9BACL|nr:hypothetical protein [Paenibacillus glycanilyticus]GLX70074.1 hypothetical protein MU1_44200 [Paenibacillus glycanilyticus]
MQAQPIVIFPNGGWRGIPPGLKSWLEELSRKRKLLAVADDAPNGVETLALEQLGSVNWSNASAIVMHAAWVHIAVPLKPRCLIAVLPGPEPEEAELWSKCRLWLCAYATMVVAGSEAFYLEQSFRRGSVFLMDGLDETSDLFAKQAIEWHIDGFESDTLIRLQQRHRASWRNGLLEQQQQEITDQASAQGYADGLFFHSVYRYLTGEADYARKLLLASFEQMLAEGRNHTLQDVYRFLSAIELEQGHLQDAVRTYGYTAQGEKEWQEAEQLTIWLASGKRLLVQARLYMLNDDYRKASALLEPLSGDPEARTLLVSAYIQMGRLDGAYSLMSARHRQSASDRRQWQHLQGTALLLAGKRHEAIHCFLQAGENIQEELHGMVELAVMDSTVRELTRGNKEAN